MKAAICLFSFSNFTFGSNAFHLKKLKIIQYDFYNRVLMSLIGLMVDPWKFDVFKTSMRILPTKVRLF